MPVLADGATEPAASAGSPTLISGCGGPLINPSTGLSNDYLNHFTEAIMVLELIIDMPECVDDLRNWRPKTYTEHFARSHFSNRLTIAAAYRDANPAVRQALDHNAELLNALTSRTRELMLQHAGTPEGEAIVRRALERLRPLISRTAAIINGTADEPSSRQGSQAAIDAMFGP